MGFWDWIDKSAKKIQEDDWKDVDPDLKNYYFTHPEAMAELQGKSTGGHKTTGTGSAAKNALVNMLTTSDLDALFAECAPAMTQKSDDAYNLNKENNIRLQEVQKILSEGKNYQELKGKYEELQKHYDELKKERDQLIQALGKGNIPQR